MTTIEEAQERFPVGCLVTMHYPRTRCPYVWEVLGHGFDDGGPTLEIRSLMRGAEGPKTMNACDARRIC